VSDFDEDRITPGCQTRGPDGYVPCEACDDGNDVDDDACSNACVPR